MRIVGGRLGGRRFPGPPGDLTRPTSERVREALASALLARDAFAGAHVLDLFAGTGALAFEAISRGAARATLVERDRRVLKALEQSRAQLGLTGECSIVGFDLSRVGPPLPEKLARGLAPGAPSDLVFADPPYASIELVPALLAALEPVLAPEALVVVEHDAKHPPQMHEDAKMAHAHTYRYGDTAVSLYRPVLEPPT